MGEEIEWLYCWSRLSSKSVSFYTGKEKYRRYFSNRPSEGGIGCSCSRDAVVYYRYTMQMKTPVVQLAHRAFVADLRLIDLIVTLTRWHAGTAHFLG